MTKPIRIHNSDDIQKINYIVSKYSFDIWIHGKSGMVDAKSLLGMFLMGLTERLTLVIDDDIDDHMKKKLLEELDSYLVDETSDDEMTEWR